MAGLRRRVNRWLAVHLPEKRLFIQTGSGTSYVRLTPLTQVGVGSASALLFGWIVAASTLVVIEQLAGDRQANRADALEEAYNSRLDELAAERDQRASEAQSAQMRFQMAMEQIGRQQTEILEAVEESRELSMALDLMRDRLSATVAKRSDIAEASDTLQSKMDVAAETIDRKSASIEDLTRTLDSLSQALAETVAERDAAATESAALAEDLAEMELRVALNSRRQDEMAEQLEAAIAMSFGPLESMFTESELDVDTLLAKVRSTHSGQGGPLTPIVSSRSFDDTSIGSRLGAVMGDIDRMNLLRIAATKVPYIMPVQASHRFTSGYGYRRDPKGGGRRMHRGIDLAAPRGTPVHATAEGVVVSAAYEGGYGKTVRIRHEFGFESVYAHLSKIRTRVGEKVSPKSRIGDMGSTGRSTGVHLHYEVHLNGRPVNPMIYLEAAKNVF